MEAIDEITKEVIEENRDEIKKIIKESVGKGIKEHLECSYSSPISRVCNEALGKQLEELFKDPEIENIVMEQKQAILDGVRNGMATIGLKMGSMLYGLFGKKMENSWDRDEYLKKIFF